MLVLLALSGGLGTGFSIDATNQSPLILAVVWALPLITLLYLRRQAESPSTKPLRVIAWVLLAGTAVYGSYTLLFILILTLGSFVWPASPAR